MRVLFCLLFFVASIASAQEFRRAETLEDVWKASFRVETSNARGSGAFFAFHGGKCYVLTNYHVVEKAQTVNLSHWGTNERKTIGARVVWRRLSENPRADFAVCEVDANDMAKLDAPFIPLAGRDSAPDQQSYIASSGCPDGRFAQAWKGKTLGRLSDTVRFQPAPVEGQSGSAIVSEIDGELWITGVLTYRTGEKGSDAAEGLAIPIANLYRAATAWSPTSDESYSVPEDWHECALRWELYTRQGCAPCVKAEENALILETNNIPVERVQYEQARSRFAEKRVEATPTWILSDDSKRIIGASTVDELTAAFRDANQVQPADAYVAPERRAVIEANPQTSQLLDDADAFFNRRSKEQSPSEGISNQTLGILGAAVCDRLEGFINKQVDAVEARVDAKIDEVSGRAVTTWKRARTQIVIAFFLAMLFAVWTADFIKGGLKKIKDIIVASLELARIQATAAKQAANVAALKYKESLGEKSDHSTDDH